MLRASLLASAATIALIGQASAQQANNAFIGQMDESNFRVSLARSGPTSGFVYQYGQKNVFLPGVDALRRMHSMARTRLAPCSWVTQLHRRSVPAERHNNIAGIAQFGDDNIVNKFLQTGEQPRRDLPGRRRQRRAERADRDRQRCRDHPAQPDCRRPGHGQLCIQHADRRREPGYLRFLLGHPSGRRGQHSLRASDPADRF